MDYDKPIGNEPIEYLIGCYYNNSEIWFVYKNQDLFLGFEDGDCVIYDGPYGDALYREKKDFALNKLMIDGMPLVEILKNSFIDSIYGCPPNYWPF
ncbi:MAG: hypothetical protein LUG60_00980 [Erysipelotrichaceae bacterium]|nr:hypothetical protein [Erysipelotrichaceae bacterium]